MANALSAAEMQSFNLTDINGDQFEVSVQDVDDVQTVATTAGILAGTQLGLTVSVLLILLITASPARRRTSVIWINAAALACNIVRCSVICAQVNGPLYKYLVLAVEGNQGPDIEADKPLSIMLLLVNLLLFLLIDISLILQVKAVFAAVTWKKRSFAIGTLCLLCLMAFGWHLNLAIISIRATLQGIYGDLASEVNWAYFVSNVVDILTLSAISAILVAKVAWLIQIRKTLGLKSFGPLQIIFTTGCQTLIIPSESLPSPEDHANLFFVILMIVFMFKLNSTRAHTFATTIITVSLPMSSVWAAANTRARVLDGLLLTEGSADAALVDYDAGDSSSAPDGCIESENAEVIGAKNSIWAQYGCRDSIMMDKIEPFFTTILPKQPSHENPARHKNSFESIASCGSGSPH